jgi:RNA polymerase sigma factor (sigma-70 family)
MEWRLPNASEGEIMRWRRRFGAIRETHQSNPGKERGEDQRRAAFTAFHDEHATAILRYCRLRISNSHDAEDVAADIFLQAWRAYPPDDRGSPRSWLFTIAHNSVANYYRRQKTRGRSRPIDEPHSEEIPDLDPTPEESYLRREQGSALFAALDCLPGNQREVVELRLAGLKGSEIAIATGRTESAVKMLQFRAMGRLRQHLSTGSEPVSGLPTRKESADALS